MGGLWVAHRLGKDLYGVATLVMQRLLIAATLFPLFVTSMKAAEAASVRLSLGGPRKVEATIRERDGAFDINVRMIGVGCFDSATNNRLNREKARLYAMHALARHLGIKHPMVVKGVTMGEARTEGKTYSLTVNVPKEGLVQANPAQVEATPNEGKAAKIDLGKFQGLLTAKDDYIATLHLLSASMLEELPPTPTKTNREDEFYKSVADLEESGAKSFVSLRKEVEADKRLLQMEVDEVLALIEKEETTFIERLKREVDRFRATAKKE